MPGSRQPDMDTCDDVRTFEERQLETRPMKVAEKERERDRERRSDADRCESDIGGSRRIRRSGWSGSPNDRHHGNVPRRNDDEHPSAIRNQCAINKALPVVSTSGRAVSPPPSPTIHRLRVCSAHQVRYRRLLRRHSIHPSILPTSRALRRFDPNPDSSSSRYVWRTDVR